MRNVFEGKLRGADLADQAAIGDFEPLIGGREARPRVVTTSAPRGPMVNRHHFVKELRHEKRRTERSRAPLSVVLFRVDIDKSGGLAVVKTLAETLGRTKRETDVLGYLGEDLMALLLPDTNEQGALALIRNVEARTGALDYATTVGTYPDQLFENLLAGETSMAETSPLFIDSPADRNVVGSFLKRSIDIAGSLALLVLTSPLMAAAMLAIVATSPGPVIFRQERLGKGGAPFVLFKLRSMAINADDSIHREYVSSLIEGRHDQLNQGDAVKPVYKLTADPRVTRVGRFLRKSSIDELPQLINVLKGDMSLVGPRPPLRYEAQKYQIWHLRRVLEIRPGITGLWQVEGRSSTSFDDMVRLDLRYMREWSFWLDCKILLKTVKVVLWRSGAV